jgi:RNA polymerase sigma-70 factor (ECF subfamily)
LNKELLPGTAEIWKLFREDSEDAFKALYHQYWADMYKAAFNILRDRDQSMDIVQELFIWLWEHRKQLDIKSSFKGYLLAAVKFKAANCIRNGRTRDDIFKRIASIQTPVFSHEAGELLEIKELEEVIRHTVEGLPEKCRTIYQLSRRERLSNKEIAHELGISVKTVENQMTIALKRLRIVLTKLFFFIVFFLHG